MDNKLVRQNSVDPAKNLSLNLNKAINLILINIKITIFYNRNPYIVISQYGGNWDYTIKNSSSQNTTINYATSNFNDNEWYNIVISCDGLGGQMNYYVNGQSVGTNTAPTSTINVASTGYIGSGGGQQYFNGKIDQVRIYSSVLSAANVTSLYNEGTVVESTDGTDSILQFIGGTGTVTFS